MKYALLASALLVAACSADRPVESDLPESVARFEDAARTPPMGWNSWDVFGLDVTEAETRAAADYMAEHLKPHGWEYVVVDIAWYGRNLTAFEDERGAGKQFYKDQNPDQIIDEWGRLIPNPALHPSAADGKGFKPLADYVHGKGLKLGIHVMRGIPWQAVEQNTPIKGTEYFARDIAVDADTATWYDGMWTINFTHPAAQAYYDSIAELYASWEVDYLKVDDINKTFWSPYRVDDIEAMSRAMLRAGRPMVLSLSPGGPDLSQANHVSRHAHMWRISSDFWDEWDALEVQFARCAKWAPYAGPGHWPDADMLPLGKIAYRAERGEPRPRMTNFTPDEQVTLMTLWSMARSPLMLGGSLPETDPATLALITNDEVLAVNQHSTGGRQLSREGDRIIWVADAPEGDVRYVAFFNTGETPLSFSMEPSAVGQAGTVGVRDLWAREDLGEASVLEAEVPSHGARLFALTPR